MNRLKYGVIVMALASVVSCSSVQVDLPSYDELLRVETQQNGRACIRQHDIRGFGSLDDEVVSVSSNRKDHYYLVTTLFRCSSLQTSFTAGFKGGFSEFCGGGRDKILTSEESCPIKHIFEFNSREEAFSAFDKAKTVRQNVRNEAEKQAAENNKTE